MYIYKYKFIFEKKQCIHELSSCIHVYISQQTGSSSHVIHLQVLSASRCLYRYQRWLMWAPVLIGYWGGFSRTDLATRSG